MVNVNLFEPHPFVRNHQTQALLSRKRPVATTIQQRSKMMILHVEGGVRLQGFYTPHPKPKGFVLLFHGWLGCTDSNYVLSVAETLYQEGYTIFRLNFRDHGDTAHLNVEAFRSDLLDEVFSAVQQVGQLATGLPLYLVGASLGGNFALRVAYRHSQTSVPNLKHIIAINPVIDPYHTTVALDNGRALYFYYFRKKWREAMHHKMTLFPEQYDLRTVIAAPNCLEMTDRFIQQYSPYAEARAYFRSYQIMPTMMQQLTTPTTILTAADDPIIPLTDFAPLYNQSPWLNIMVQPYGGHVGYYHIFPLRTWLDEAVKTILMD